MVRHRLLTGVGIPHRFHVSNGILRVDLVATTLPGPWWDQVHAQARQAVFPQHGRALQDRQQDLGKERATDDILSISTNAFTL